MFRPIIRIDLYVTWSIPLRSWPWPDVKFSKWPLNVKLWFIRRVSKREIRHGKMNAVPLLSQELLQKKKLFSKKLLFLGFLLYRGQTIDLRSNLRAQRRKSVKRAIECAILGRCSSSGSRVMCRFVEKCWKRQTLTFGDLWWPDLWPNLKNDRPIFVMIFGALSNAAYCVSLHGPGAELGVGEVFKHPPRPGVFGAEQRPGAG